MKEIKVADILKETGVIKEGHFLLTSGRHSGQFLQCSQVLQYPHYAELLCRMIAAPFENKKIETVIGPAMGGVILAYETVRALGARAIFAEPADGKMGLRRGFQVQKNERVLVVEDAITTGGSVRKVLDILEEVGAHIVGISIMVDRTGGKINMGYPVHSLLAWDIESYDPQECPLCKEKLLLVKPKS